MTVFFVVVLIGLVILAIALLVGSDSPDPDGGIGAAIALVPICLIGFVVLVMLAFENFLVFLIVFAVIAAIGGLFFFFISKIFSAREESETDEEREERAQDAIRSAQEMTESFVRELVNEVLASRRYYISVLVENSVVVSRSNDSEEIRGALGKNEVDILKVIRSDQSAGGSDNFVGEVHIDYTVAVGSEEDPFCYWPVEVTCCSDHDWLLRVVSDLFSAHSGGNEAFLLDGSGNQFGIRRELNFQDGSDR